MGVDRTWSLIQQKFGPIEIFPNFVSVFPIMTQHHKGAFGTLPLFLVLASKPDLRGMECGRESTSLR